MRDPLPQYDEKDEEKEQDDDQDPFKALPEEEAEILRRQLEIPPVTVTYRQLYRYATRNDMIILWVSAFCAIAAGAAMPLMTVVFGNLAGEFQGFFLGTVTPDVFRSEISRLTLYFVYLAIGEFVTSYICTVGYIYAGEHITAKIRQRYLESILRQNIGYFDKLGAGEITTRITADTNLIQDGISEKVGLSLTALATFISAYAIGYYKYWKLTLILSSTIVAIFLTMAVLGQFIVKFQKNSLASYAEGGTVAEEVISSIRNAIAFGTQDKLAKEYDKHLTLAERAGFRMKAFTGGMIAFLMMYVFLTYSLCFWLGAKYIVSGETTLTNVLTILLSIMIGAFALGNVAPNVQAFTTAVAAASKIYATIDRQSPLDPTSSEGRVLEKLAGTVELRKVKHIYPSRPEVVVMDGVDLVVPAGKTTALVGASGSGKSTIVGLVERFYDPVGGEVLLDGVKVSDLNLRWLRQQISLVSQEPTLFATTIAENIRHGLIGTRHEGMSETETRNLVEDAARKANAHDFISQLPEGYQTNVGERGFLLSGGQKQRIAIARAIVSDPKILLLDEATSALDTKSEGVVQAALDKAAEGRTTIVIAHRLSTIKNADNIVVMSKGKIVEQGTHQLLLWKKGAYYNLVEAQRIAQEKEEKQREDDEIETRLMNRHTFEDKSFGTPGYQGSHDSAGLELLQMTEAQEQAAGVEFANLQKQGVDHEKYSTWSLVKMIGGYNKQEIPYMLLGLFLAIIAGGAQPVQSVFFSKSIVALAEPPSRYAELQEQASFWAWMFFMLAMVQFVALIIQGVAFAYCSERLVHRARDSAFRYMLRQDVEFFDREENSAGSLTSFLSTETTHLAGMSGTTLGTILQVLTTLIGGFILSLAIGWKLALVCIATVPVIVGCGFLRFWMLVRFQGRAKQAYEKSASFACEATSAIRTVASLTREEDVLKLYADQLNSQGAKSLSTILNSSSLYAASQSLMFCCVALGFWYGGNLISTHEYDLFEFFLCFSAVIFGAQSAGTVFSFAPDMGKAKHAAVEIKALTERQPTIDSWSKEGTHISDMKGLVEFRDVHFRYPTRPEQPILRGLNLTIRPGQFVALVGASGCGKSTTIALLERFYDPVMGGVMVDGHDISSLNVANYRNHIALVSQEPTLYQGTVRDNILLGADKRPEDVPEEAIIQACKDANIYEFILSLPEAFNTVVGNKGSMLSGGQKQRIAIARALLRDPKILLLDEATSALDSESEKVVQAALDKAAKGRTTIAVAHRLSTIQKADVIFVFDAGRVVESGTHTDLLAKRGRYYELVNLQSLGGASS
ncbi:P-loop containing nucleoside triphosphate hydrolase protein [Dissoconium aciculare CBS 342.82]|uniref:P-loop containing nucleoside triphosphate hydrolase protein n=1 Tax=Dissoconium aciculare CBS 342.82 TaxID=1314786 RepID=A0A6J3M5D3_9PEZI|nr:P-loop containing nucleoside triphosphate hydrolase protein [Dissoconium aciculare CBS 342.82]KAF1823088.1 P-loop containing nucleoside triphosphate hydrolase protein [Dissoconium aciculare CBS 342.82]